MGRKVDINDLVDARGVAELLGLSHPNTVSVYQHRYADMPAPALDLGDRRVKLWLRSEITAWAVKLEAEGRNKPGRRPAR
jgi:predicted DNA-binding transcriptional regulator AlpA